MSDWKKRNEDWRDEDELLYAHTQNKPRLELTEKIEADFYTQDVAGAKPQEPPENKTPVATKITGKIIDSEIQGSLPAANVTVKGTAEGVSTDIDGKFSLSTSKTEGEVVITFFVLDSIEISVSSAFSSTNKWYFESVH